MYQYCDINLRAILSEGEGRMWPPGLQLPTPDVVYKECDLNLATKKEVEETVLGAHHSMA